MIWLFDRDGQKLRYEICRDRGAGRYRLVVTHPDGHEVVEVLDEASDLIERSTKLMESLRHDGWTLP